MKEPRDMSDRELDEAIAEEVMGQTVAAEEWPCFLYEDTSEIVPQHHVALAYMFSYEPVLYRKDEDGLGTLVICPRYTTDARETEKVMSRMVDLRWEVFISFRYSCEKSVQMIPNVWYEGREDCPDIDVHARDLKRAVCEAALLAVRGAAQ